MNLFSKIFLSLVLALFIFSCASKIPSHDLPSAGTSKKPEWVGTDKVARDTIFIVIQLPEEKTLDMDISVQKAQSHLHTLLVVEIETILRDYWEEKAIGYTNDEQFQLLSELPFTLEQIMNHVEVVDGWEKAGEVSILCALDYEEMADILMENMQIQDRAFLEYFKRRMDELSEKYR